MNNTELTGKVAVVTGASSGIGEATARALAAAGAKVAIIARRADRLESLAKQITDNGGIALALPGDITDEAQIHRAIQTVKNTWGGLDILVNNAGYSVLGPILNADTEEWRKAVNVNLMGLLYTTHAALPLLKERGSGHIVNISSTAARVAPSGMAVYCATKWGVNGFTESLRQEAIAYNVRVTVIEPGFVNTELVENTKDEASRTAMTARLESMRALDAADIASAVVYAATQPAHVNVGEIVVRPTQQA